MGRRPVPPMGQRPVSPMAQRPVSPMTQRPVSPMTQRPVSPMAQRPVSPMTQRPVSPMGQLVDVLFANSYRISWEVLLFIICLKRPSQHVEYSVESPEKAAKTHHTTKTVRCSFLEQHDNIQHAATTRSPSPRALRRSLPGS